MHLVTLLVVCVTAVVATPHTLPSNSKNDVPTLTTIANWPSQASLMQSPNGIFFRHYCGAGLINNRSVITAAHCVRTVAFYHQPDRLRLRFGSTYASSGGVIYNVARTILHPGYGPWSYDNDIALIRTTNAISYSNVIQQGTIAGVNYPLGDDQMVKLVGWGGTWGSGFSEHLHEVELWTKNQEKCIKLFEQFFDVITPNMLCTNARFNYQGECLGDSGSPIYHGHIIVGLQSYIRVCTTTTPSVNVRISQFTPWIVENA